MAGDQTEVLEQIKRFLDVLVRLKIEEIRANRSQTQMIVFLDSVGCNPTEIAEILGTTTKTVNPILSKARRKKK